MNETVKNLFDKVKDTAATAGEVAGRTFDSASKWAGEIWEVTRLNHYISELQNKEKSLLADVGSLVFRAYKDPMTDTDNVDEMLDNISAVKAEIEESKEKVNDLRAVRNCPKCEKKLNRHDVYCRFCGEKL